MSCPGDSRGPRRAQVAQVWQLAPSISICTQANSPLRHGPRPQWLYPSVLYRKEWQGSHHVIQVLEGSGGEPACTTKHDPSAATDTAEHCTALHCKTGASIVETAVGAEAYACRLASDSCLPPQSPHGRGGRHPPLGARFLLAQCCQHITTYAMHGTEQSSGLQPTTPTPNVFLTTGL
jgi:hypothetical protein